MVKSNEIEKTKYLNPYIGGVFLGIVLLAANFVSGRGLGASGAIKSTVVTTMKTVAPASSAKTAFVNEYSEAHPGKPYENLACI